MGLLSASFFVVGLCFLVSTVLTFPTGTTEIIEIGTELPVFYEVAAEEISITEREERDSIPEDEITTTLWSVTDNPAADGEESTQTPFPRAQFTHPDQEEIMNELHNIWYYSEGLNEDQNDLKSSLSSLVHMTYARVYDQQDETLSRLKYLLRKLRTRLLREETYDEPTTTEMLLTSELENNETMPTEAIVMRRKRSSIEGEERHHNTILENADPDENSLYPSLNKINDNGLQKHKLTAVSTASPEETTIQKIIQVQDRLPLVTYEEIDLEIPKNPITVSPSTDMTTKNTFQINETNFEIIKQDSVNKYEQNKKPVTVEEIIDRIISVLQAPMKIKDSTSKPTSGIQHQTPIVIKLRPLTSSYATNDKEEFNHLPSYLKTFMGMKPFPSNKLNISESSGQITHNSTTFLPSPSIDELTEKETSFIFDVSTSKPDSSELSEIQEMTSTEMLSSPTKFLDGTMAGMFTLINTLGSLSNAARMVLLFAITALILSVALGFNSSLGPPIAVLGGLAFIIPIFLLLLFQSNKTKLKSVRDNIWNTVNIQDINRILELLADAANKYE